VARVIDVLVDDLAFVAADTIARPVNGELRAITPVMRRLESAAGDALARQLRVNEPLAVGSAVVTGAGSLGVELLIHAVVATDTESVTRDGVRRATTSALQRAHDFDVARLAIAPFGLGAGNLDVDDAAQTRAAAIGDHRLCSVRPSEIVVVVESELEAEAFRAALARLERNA
jgi:O-acetyl-ADP-ribose deacetylase (regulator of RNase III)